MTIAKGTLTDLILAALEQAGDRGATSRELVTITGGARESVACTLNRLREAGTVERANAHRPGSGTRLIHIWHLPGVTLSDESANWWFAVVDYKRWARVCLTQDEDEAAEALVRGTVCGRGASRLEAIDRAYTAAARVAAVLADYRRRVSRGKADS